MPFANTKLAAVVCKSDAQVAVPFNVTVLLNVFAPVMLFALNVTALPEASVVVPVMVKATRPIVLVPEAIVKSPATFTTPVAVPFIEAPDRVNACREVVPAKVASANVPDMLLLPLTVKF